MAASTASEGPRVTLAHCVLDLAEGVVHRGEGRTSLSTKEQALLRFLLARPGEVIDRYTLLEEVWGYDSSKVVSRAVDTTVCRLRRKIEADPSSPALLRTVPGEGYVWSRAESPPEPQVPSNLDPEGGRFVGRKAELAWLDQHAQAGAVVVLSGPPGVGKSRLARTWARLRASRAPTLDGVTCCNLRDAASLGEVAHLASWALELPQLRASSPGAAVDEIGKALAWRGPQLVILDDVTGDPAPALQAAERWAALAPEVLVLVTSRTQPAAGRCRVLPPLPADEAQELVRDRAVQAGAPVERLAPAALDRLVARADRLPLSLELAAVQLRVFDASVVEERMGPGGMLLPSGAQPSLRRSLDASWRSLSPGARATLAALSWFPGSAPTGALAAMTQLSLDHVGQALSQLERASLLTRNVDGPLLESVRAFGRERADLLGSDAERRVVDWLSAQAIAWVDQIPTAQSAEAVDALLDARDALSKAAGVVAATDPGRAASVGLAPWIAERCLGRGDLLRVSELDTLAGWARTAGDARTTSQVLELRAWVRRAAGALDAALDDSHLALDAAPVGSREHVRALRSVADILRLKGEHARAVEAAREALRVAVAPPSVDSTARGHAHCTLGLVLMSQSDFDEAERSLLAAAEAFEEAGDLRELGSTWNLLGTVAGRRWRQAQARERYSRGLELNLATGNEHQEVISRMGLAARYLDERDTTAARTLLLPALERYRTAGQPRMQGFALAQLACADHLEEQLDAAAARFQAARERFLHTDRLNAALALHALGIIALERGHAASARDTLEQALTEAEGCNDRVARLVCGGWLAVAEAAAGGNAAATRLAALRGEPGHPLPGEFAGFLELCATLVDAYSATAVSPPAPHEHEGFEHAIARRLLARLAS